MRCVTVCCAMLSSVTFGFGRCGAIGFAGFSFVVLSWVQFWQVRCVTVGKVGFVPFWQVRFVLLR